MGRTARTRCVAPVAPSRTDGPATTAGGTCLAHCRKRSDLWSYSKARMGRMAQEGQLTRDTHVWTRVGTAGCAQAT